MDRFRKKLGERIKSFRQGLGLSQEQLAKRLKMNRVSLSQVEGGQREVSAREIAEMSRIFGITSDILLDLEKEIEVIIEKTGAKRTTAPKTAGIRISVPLENVEKFKEVLLYVLNKVGSKANVGQTVLYKLLYFIDFDFYEKYEEQLMGARYQKNHHGPTPVEFAKIVKEMEGLDIVTVADQYFQYPRTKFLPKRKPDLSKLSSREVETIDEVLSRLSDMNASQISDYSHDDVPWMTTEDGGIIDYEAVFYRTKPYSVRSYGEEEVQ